MSEDVLFIDVETRSVVDLKRYGLYRYATDPSTDLYCMGFAFNDEPVQIIYFYNDMIRSEDDAAIPRILNHVKNGASVAAHNAQFEFAIWNYILTDQRYNFPALSQDQMICTMVRSYAMGLPGNLEDAGSALGLDVSKDATGRELMVRMSKPQNLKTVVEKGVRPIWLSDVEQFTFLGEKVSGEWALRRLGEYCKTDVQVERDIFNRTYALSTKERLVYCVDQDINRRGVLFDPEAVDAALSVRDEALESLNNKLATVTEGAVKTTSAVAALKDWAALYGVVTDSVAKFTLRDLMEKPLPAPVREAFKLREEAGRATSVAKLDAAKRYAGADGRVRYLYQYHGAHTGRWAGRGIQTHNLTRDLPPPGDVERIMQLIKDRQIELLDMLYGPPLTVISKVLRGFIVAAEGLSLIGGDWSNVEGRALAWLAGEDWKLRAFKQADAGLGPDIYIQSYSRSFGVPIDEVGADQRQLGKVLELSMGYGGGVGAFKAMAKTYGVDPGEDDENEKRKHAWRQTHPRIVDYWYRLEDAAHSAMLSQGNTFSAGPHDREVKFRKVGSFLWCLLPSGRVLSYPYPSLINDDDWGRQLTYKTVPSQDERQSKRIVSDKSNTRNWARVSTYGGKLAENITQAICRDILAEAMLRLEARAYQVVMHVHDEVVLEGQFSERERERVEVLMSETPEWAEGLPLTAGCWLDRRYRKE